MQAQEAYALLARRKCCFCGATLLSITARYTSETATEKTKFYSCQHCGTYSEFEVDDYALGTTDYSPTPSDADSGL